MSTTTNTQAVPDDLDLMHADQITRIWRECQSQGLDHVAFAWRIEREGWRRLLTALTSAPPAPSVGGWMPIETIPQDGSHVLVWVQAGQYEDDDEGTPVTTDQSFCDIGWWRTGTGLVEDGFVDYGGMSTFDAEMVTHWQPMPQPPKEKP